MHIFGSIVCDSVDR